MSAPESCKVKDSTAVVKAREVSRLTIPITFLWSIYDDSYIYISKTPLNQGAGMLGVYTFYSITGRKIHFQDF